MTTNQIIPQRSVFLRMIQMAAMLVISVSATAADLGDVLNTDGWHSWKVKAANDSQNWCCGVWQNDKIHVEECNLDAKGGNSHWSYTEDSEKSKTNEWMRIYTKVESGRVAKIRTLGESCAVKTESPIQNHNDVDGNQSVDWLSRQARNSGEVGKSALPAIAVHAGTRSLNTLVSIAKTDASIERRKESIFWLGQVRGKESIDDLHDMMRNDKAAEVREHAIFSISQSDVPNKSRYLKSAGQQDSDPDVRSKAWFWLAQSDDPGAAKYIIEALDHEKNREVREQAVFALSQLDEPLAVDALISVITNKRMTRQSRKKALFWLAQTESDEAIEFLDAYLTR